MTDKNEKPSSEGELIDLFRDLFEPEERPPDLIIGIGDDAAAIEPGVDPESKFVITTDMLVEDVHFIRELHTPYDIGWRTATANISDIAAMGALPRWGVTTLAAPPDMTRDDILDFAKGLKDAMSEFDALLIGGDLTRSTGKISVSMTVIGETTSTLMKRSNAEIGDVIAVTGTLGDSSLGLHLLKNPDLPVVGQVRGNLINHHKHPVARVGHGQIFANNDGIHSMMDISDGVGIDLGRICAASGLGGRIFEDRLPLSDDFRKAIEVMGADPLKFALGGEDFELLITGTEDSVKYIQKYFEEESIEPGLTIIGEIIDQPFGIHLGRIDGSVINPAETGWDHFRK